MIRMVIFDLDGTLVDSEPIAVAARAAVLRGEKLTRSAICRSAFLTALSSFIMINDDGVARRPNRCAHD